MAKVKQVNTITVDIASEAIHCSKNKSALTYMVVIPLAEEKNPRGSPWKL